MIRKFINQTLGRTKRPDRELAEHKTCFIHIPKCAGQSVVMALKRCYDGKPSASMDYGPALEAFKRYHAETSTFEETEASWGLFRVFLLDYYLGKGVDCVYGHFPCPTRTIEHFSNTHKFITVLREPVARFISNYIYDRTGPMRGLYKSDLNPEDELEQFLESEDAKWLANTQVSMIGGYCRAHESLNSTLERAMKNLELYAVVGVTEDLQTFVSQAREKTGLNLEIERVNTTKQWESESASDFDYRSLFCERVTAKIAELSGFDDALYKYANQLKNRQA